jgi:aldose 1-epimerase
VAVRVECAGELEGRRVARFFMEDGNGLAVRLMEYGATLTQLHVPDQSGRTADIVLGFDDLQGYIATKHYIGASVGRYANRIRNGSFSIGGKAYLLSRNEGSNHLHGGLRGFDKVLWRGEPKPDGNGVRFSYSSPAGSEGYPGAVEAQVEYRLPGGGRLAIEFTATAAAPTIVNLVNHSYFNLAGHASGHVLNQTVMLNAECYTPVDLERIPTGEIAPALGTPFDFTSAKPIGRDLLHIPPGYDHNWILRGDGMRLCARVSEPCSGRSFELWTGEPGVQLYIGGYFDGSEKGKQGCHYQRFAGFTLETQRLPSGMFPLAELWPGQTYKHSMEFRFDAGDGSRDRL